jgi:hypothetical protein
LPFWTLRSLNLGWCRGFDGDRGLLDDRLHFVCWFGRTSARGEQADA